MESRPDANFRQEPPQISLPTGGGAIRGIGEKFCANPVTGTGSLSVPIATSAGRAGFGPALTLSYDSGAGNGPFGLGWRLSLPAITRKTDKGLPRYRDSVESDVFILAGAEDLVPVLDAKGELPEPEAFVVYGSVYLVRTYRPRVESAFALIERWTEQSAPSNMFWRTVSRDNVTTWYGRSPASRVADPADATRIFEWRPTEQSDDRGNVMLFDYRREDAAGIDTSMLAEANREHAQRTANTYLHRIRYGNLAPYLPTLSSTGTRWPAPDEEAGQQWMFEVVFDYGDYPGAAPTTRATATWSPRPDPFSAHRAGFEVRTYRLCRRVLMFHHFEAELGAADYLVRSTDFTYAEPDDLADPRRAGYTVLTSLTQRAYQKRALTDDVYESRQWPPLSFKYSSAEIDKTPRLLARSQLENLPVGTQGAGYRWVDLDGEGLPGVLTEQAGSWHYKPNVGDGNFGPMRTLAAKPAFAALTTGGQQLMDLGGDGALELVDFGGPVAGFQERDAGTGWKRFVPFAALPNIDWNDPNLRFVDLTGDGLADVLITENEVFTWYPTLGEDGFGAAERALKASTEERGPRLVFADGTQTIFLADMTGDGLTDFVRVRNRDVSYWPNLGHGSFGRKVSLGNAPQFDRDELYDPRRVRLGDIDGSGPADIVYLGHDRTRIYLNRSGNSLSTGLEVDLPVATHNLDAVQLADLFGNGTACLVWNSALPGDASQPVWYIDLMGGSGTTAQHGKPHLLIGVGNNLGATTEIEYTPSTRFYLEDRRLGRPWITRLPFPVHCVSRITLRDRWRGTEFSSRYSYHHGYFDGVEREFRGFGRVEQVDVEDYGTTGVSSPYVTSDKRLHQPPVKTVTWHHTGAALDQQRILSQFEGEYFPARYAFSGTFREKPLAEPVLPSDLTTDEWREALRACKGMVLRQEVYELELRDLAGAAPRETPVRIFSVATHNCRIAVLQRRGVNRHAVFQLMEGEALSYQYDLALPRGAAAVEPDPRVSHAINLRHDEQGNLLQAITIAYGRWRPGDYATLPRAALIANVQAERHLSYAEARYTQDVIEPPRTPGTQRAIRHRRLRLPCEAFTYELKGIAAANADYYEPADFVALDLSEVYGHRPGETAPARSVELKQYHEWADGQRAQKRLVERARTLYFDDASDTSAPVAAAAFGRHGPRGLKYETYKLALTDALLDAVFTQRDAAGNVVDDKLAWVVEPAAGGAPAIAARDLLDRPIAPGSPCLASGYILGSGIHAALNGQYWMRSGTAGFAPDAQRHFFIPERYTDPFGNVTTLQLDGRDLFAIASTDARGNSVSVERFDYRVLAAQRLRDINANVSAMAFDVRGLPAASAQMGKVTGAQPAASESGDDVDDLSFDQLNPATEDVAAFLSASYSGRGVRRWLGKATTRFIYHFGEALDAHGALVWLASPPAALGIVREQHERDFPNVDSPDETQLLPVQVAVEYSDGSGAVLVKKSQAEADATDTRAPPPLRWIASGKTILNNKGKPVKQFEPYFSATEHRFDATEAEREVGVTPLLFYDAPGRLVRTELPDGTLSRVELSPWHVANYDANDTVLESRWYIERNAPGAADPEPADPATRAAWLAAQHANTPALVLFDSLGRNVIAIAHNRAPDANGVWQDARYATFTKLDAEGKPLWVRDARGNLVTQYIAPNKPTQLANDPTGEDQPPASVPCYDIAGNLLYLHGMDSGDRWTLTDGAGKPMLAWDINERTLDDGSTLVERRLYTTAYDELHRPLEMWLGINGGARSLIETFDYLDTNSFRDAAGNLDQAGLDTARADNLLAHAISHYDSSGRATIERFDFKGALEEETRTLVSDVARALVDWSVQDRATLLESETFRRIAEHDALGRMTRLFNWHRDTTAGNPTPGQSDRVAVYVPRYNARGLVEGERLHVRARKTTANGRADFVPDAAAARNVDAIRHVEWDVKGRRSRLELGNGTVTHYSYDAKTFRLIRLYTRRDARFATDCGGPPPPPRSTAPDTDDAPRSCGVQNLRYTYDAAGNLTRVQDDAQDIIWFANTQTDASSNYTYDALYRLISATGRENTAAQAPPPHPEGNWPMGPLPSVDAVNRYSQSYVYDEVGNFVEMKHRASRQAGQPTGDWTRHYSVAADSNRLTSTWYGNNVNDAVNYRYDTHGSMRNLANTAPALDMRWDYRDMIRALDLQGGGAAYYNYGVDKQRSRKLLVRNPTAANGGTRREDRVYLGGYELYRRYTGDPADPVEEIESHHLFEGQQRVLLVDDVIRTRNPRPDGAGVRVQTLFRYQYGNHLGSACAELGSDAEVISYEEYHPYGTSAYRAMHSAIEAPPKRYRYAGMERDEESGLGYCHARYHSGLLGRWVSADPDPPRGSLNDYAFVACQPINNKERNGCDWGDFAEGFAPAFATSLVTAAMIGIMIASAPVSIPTVLTVGLVTTAIASTGVQYVSIEQQRTLRAITEKEADKRKGALAGSFLGAVLGGGVKGPPTINPGMGTATVATSLTTDLVGEGLGILFAMQTQRPAGGSPETSRSSKDEERSSAREPEQKKEPAPQQKPPPEGENEPSAGLPKNPREGLGLGGSGRLKHLDTVGESELAERVHEYRLKNMKTREVDLAENVAALEFKDPRTGKLETRIAQSDGNLHAEEILIRDLQKELGDLFSFDLIEKLYTERVPCQEPGHDCYSLIRTNLAKAIIEYSFENTYDLIRSYLPNFDARGNIKPEPKAGSSGAW